jgi:hypothetical protein
MAATLAATVYVTDPDTRQTVVLEVGSEPEPRLAALVTNPAAWEDGQPPTDAAESKPAAKRAARKPARGRDAADEGSSGE